MMKKVGLLISIGILCTSSGCSKGSGSTVQAKSIAVNPTAATVEAQPTMFEWNGVHNGMSVAEFKAIRGARCGESRSGNYACILGDMGSISAGFFHGQAYTFRVFCDTDPSDRTYKDLCKPLLAAVKGHFGELKYDDEKYGQRAIGWTSSLELAQYVPPTENNATRNGVLEVCSPQLAPRRGCRPH